MTGLHATAAQSDGWRAAHFLPDIIHAGSLTTLALIHLSHGFQVGGLGIVI
jgi:hypothetical protein